MFTTALQCVMECTAMDREFFKRLAVQSNKFARVQMIAKTSTLYCGIKWKNISACEMIQFFGILLWMSIGPCNMGRYKSYFTTSPHVILGKKYSVGLRDLDCWAKQIMMLSRFKYIRCAVHPEGAKFSNNGNKYHQLRHFICTFNRKARKIFHLCPYAP
eukprot:7585654-Ditylum_brightwellii.AAC.1